MSPLLSSSVRFAIVSVLLAGAVWPASTAVALGVLFPWKAHGSLVVDDGVVVGSALVGQVFEAPGHLHGRPSAAGYDPREAAGSNLGVSDPALRARVEADARALGVALPPPDALAASGSGVDPHVTPAHAALQVPRIAAARGVSEAEVAAVVAAHTEVGWLGGPRVDVFAVNRALDAR